MVEAVFSWLITYRYWVALPITVFAGPIVMVVCGFLLKLGYFSLIPVYFILLLGDLIGDFLWYGVGYYGARRLVRRYGRFVSLTDRVMDKIEEVFKRYQNKILFISKITMGLGFALVTLITAGATRVPIKNYAILNILGGFIWTAFLLALGYFFGNLYLLIDKAFRLLFLVAVTTLVILAFWGLKNYIKQKVVGGKL